MEIQYSANTPDTFRYRVVLWTHPNILDLDFWYVHDTKRNTFRKIGRIGAKRTNNFDNAIKFCEDKQNQL